MSLEKLRSLYQDAKEKNDTELMGRIDVAGKAAKNNPVFGGENKGGNGYCYTCLIEPARPDYYNCHLCAATYTPREAKKYDKYDLQLKVLDLGKRWRQKPKVMVEQISQMEAERIFA